MSAYADIGDKKLSNVPVAAHRCPKYCAEEARETELKPIDNGRVHNPVNTGNTDILSVHEVCDTLVGSTSSSVCCKREREVTCCRVYEEATE